jgi:hypothetical protein
MEEREKSRSPLWEEDLSFLYSSGIYDRCINPEWYYGPE